jgi:hypothetical protein
MRGIWEATDEVARVLSEIPIVRRHAYALGTWRQVDPTDHVRQVLHADHFSSTWESHPLLMGLPYSQRADAAMAARPEGEAWLRGALQVGVGFGRIVEWLRSRLPGYPRLLVPQLTATSVRCQESGFFFGPGFPWWRTFRLEAPQFDNRVSVETFELDDADAERLREVTAGLSRALRESEPFTGFAAAYAALDDSIVTELRGLASTYRDQTRDERVDEVEPDNMMRRHRFFEAVMEETRASGSATASSYIASFERVDELISAVARVIEELVVHGPPAGVGAVAEGTWRAGRFGYRVRLTTTEDASFVGSVRMVEVTSDVASLAGVVLTDAQTVSFGPQTTSVSTAITGELLPCSAGTLRSGPAR